MAESTCLHIQDRESGPIRIVEIPWISVRIGRAAFCEVRLTDPALPELACRLHRRGRTWHLTPLGVGPTTIDGRTVETARALDFDAPFEVGPYTLALKRNKFAEPDWRPPRSTPRAARRPEPPSFSRPEGFTPRPIPDRPAPEPAPANSWEARWKAAGDRLKSSPTAARPAPPAPPRAEPYNPTRPTPAAPPKYAPAPASARFEPAEFTPRPIPTPTPTPTPTLAVAAELETLHSNGASAAAPEVEARAEVEAPVEARTAAPRSFFDSMSDPVSWAAEAPVRGEAVSTVPVDDQPRPATVNEAAEDQAAEDQAVEVEVEPALLDDAASLYEIDSCDDEQSLYEAEPIALASSPAVESPTEWAFAPEPEPEPEPEPGPESEPEPEPAPPPRSVVATAPRPEVDRARDWARLEAERLDRRGREERAEVQPTPPPAPRLDRGRRDEDDHRERFDPTRSPRPRDGRPPAEPALPSVQDVLTASQWTTRRPAQPAPAPTTAPAPAPARPRPKPAPAPTTAVAPAQWSLPAWLVWPPATFLTLALGAAFTVGSWWWAVDSKNAAIAGRTAVALRLGTAKDRPLPLGVTPPATSWWRTTPRHLAQWSNYLSNTRVDHGWAETPGFLAEAASAMAPLDPLAHLARARTGGSAEGRPEDPAQGLGLSRDAVSLAWTARTLHKAGKNEAAVQAYRRALEVAERSEPARDEPLVFSEDPDAPRYLLPGETLAAAVVGELLADLSWTYADWKGAIPKGSVAALVTVKGLRAQGRSEADAALGDLASSPRPLDDAAGADDRPASRRAVEHAVAAEALLMRSALKDAQLQYRAAVALMDDDRIKRSWWFNLADVAARLNDENQRRIALGNVLAAVDADEVSRRAMDLQRGDVSRGRSRPNGPRAN